MKGAKIANDPLLKPGEKRAKTFHIAIPDDTPPMDVIAILSDAPVQGSDDCLKTIETEASLGRNIRSFLEVKIMQKKQNVLR
ncbi:MAG: hypothetical protein OEZ41_11535 [Nitrospirota bacterium]|nr:hypothetical protein [Nitrospirota bacterium]